MENALPPGENSHLVGRQPTPEPNDHEANPDAVQGNGPEGAPDDLSYRTVGTEEAPGDFPYRTGDPEEAPGDFLYRTGDPEEAPEDDAEGFSYGSGPPDDDAEANPVVLRVEAPKKETMTTGVLTFRLIFLVAAPIPNDL